MQQFDAFAVLFQGDDLIVGEKRYPLGQITIDILNLDDRTVEKLKDASFLFSSAVQKLLESKSLDDMKEAHQAYTSYLNLWFPLPPYRDLPLDKELTCNMFPMLYEQQEKWAEAMEDGSEKNTELKKFIRILTEMPVRLEIFRNQIRLMLMGYFESLPRWNSETYGASYSRYFSEMIIGGALFFPDTEFQQSFPAELSFVPYRGGMAEETQFDQPTALFYADFYRAMMHGNLPRQCHNCGRYFLLTKGYNTCYCNNIAPGETERTCRKVGAHRRESMEKASATPAQQEYTKTYNRLKARKQRRKISIDEWNAAIAAAQELKDRAERGELDEAEYRKLLYEL